METRMRVYCEMRKTSIVEKSESINHLPLHILKTINKLGCCINQFKVSTLSFDRLNFLVLINVTFDRPDEGAKISY
jgi:hypothetical protein